jgi:hypothetical protein
MPHLAQITLVLLLQKRRRCKRKWRVTYNLNLA